MIIVARFIDGAEIIGELSGESENGIQVSNPLQIVYKHTPTSNVPTVSFVRFMMFAAETQFDFQKVDFIAVTPATPAAIPLYKRMIAQLQTQDAALQQSTSTSIDPEDFYNKLLQSLDPEDMTKQ